MNKIKKQTDKSQGRKLSSLGFLDSILCAFFVSKFLINNFPVVSGSFSTTFEEKERGRERKGGS